MSFAQRLVSVVVAGLILTLGACARATPTPTTIPAPAPRTTRAATPTPGPTPTPSPTPQPTATPTPTPSPTPTPRPTPTLGPNAVGATDTLHDPIYCSTGKPALYMLPPALDLWHAAMQAVTDPENEQCFFEVVILPAEPVGSTRFSGGVEFYHPEAPLRRPPNPTWFFDNIAYVSFNFLWVPGTGELRTWPERIYQGRWVKTSTIVGYTGTVDEQGRLLLRLPCAAVRPGSTWMVALTGEKATKCDALGVAADTQLPALPLPPTPAP